MRVETEFLPGNPVSIAVDHDNSRQFFGRLSLKCDGAVCHTSLMKKYRDMISLSTPSLRQLVRPSGAVRFFGRHEGQREIAMTA